VAKQPQRFGLFFSLFFLPPPCVERYLPPCLFNCFLRSFTGFFFLESLFCPPFYLHFFHHLHGRPAMEIGTVSGLKNSLVCHWLLLSTLPPFFKFLTASHNLTTTLLESSSSWTPSLTPFLFTQTLPLSPVRHVGLLKVIQESSSERIVVPRQWTSSQIFSRPPQQNIWETFAPIIPRSWYICP